MACINVNPTLVFTCFFLCFSICFPSSSCTIGMSPSCIRNSHRHCTGKTSSDPSLDSTRSANHGIDWEVPWNCMPTLTRKMHNTNHYKIWIWIYQKYFDSDIVKHKMFLSTYKLYINCNQNLNNLTCFSENKIASNDWQWTFMIRDNKDKHCHW